MPAHKIEILQNLSIPRPSSGNLAALGESDRPIAVFSDFDGTIFLQDTGHVLFDNFGCGKAKREELDKSIGKTKTFREASEELWGSLNVTLPEAIKQLKKDLIIDPDFYTFFEYLEEHGIPFTVISAGMKPLLRAALDEFLGPERSAKINIVSNEGVISEDGSSWKAIWRHDSPLGHDKAKSVIEWKESITEGPIPRVVFIGDGVSDLAAASQADILFARQGLALEVFCIENMIPYIPYMRFNDIIHDIKRLVRGNRFHDDEAAKQYRVQKLSSITGLKPLTNAPEKKKATFGLGESSSDSDDDEDGDEASGDAVAHPPHPAQRRPSSPTAKPDFTNLDPPPLSRNVSVGEVVQATSK